MTHPICRSELSEAVFHGMETQTRGHAWIIQLVAKQGSFPWNSDGDARGKNKDLERFEEPVSLIVADNYVTGMVTTDIFGFRHVTRRSRSGRYTTRHYEDLSTRRKGTKQEADVFYIIIIILISWRQRLCLAVIQKLYYDFMHLVF